MERPITPRVLPFCLSTSAYLSMGFHNATNNHTWTKVILKCLPIYCLAYFVFLNMKDQKNRYAQKIAIGLALSSIGDACLVFPHYFIHGMVAFALAHICYISAFGWEPLFHKIGAVLFLLAFSAVAVLLPELKSIFTIAVPVYSILLATMAWRSVAKYQHSPNWLHLAGALGAICFFVSDGVIAVDKFYTPVPYAQLIIMSTYYAAQLGIALSTVTTSAAKKSQ